MFGFFKKPQRDLSESEQLNKQLMAVQKVSHELKNVSDIEKILGAIVNELGKELEYLNPVIYLLNEDKKTFSVRKTNVSEVVVGFTSKLVGKSVYDVKFKLSDPSLLAKSILTKETQFTTNFHDLFNPYLSQASSRIVQMGLRIGSTVIAPLVLEGEALGCVTVASRKSTFTAPEIRVIETFADQISIAIYNAQLFKEKQEQINEVEQKNKDLESLFALTSEIGQTLDSSKVASTAAQSLANSDLILGIVVLKYFPDDKSISLWSMTRTALTDPVERIAGDFTKYKSYVDEPEFANNPVVKVAKSLKPESGTVKDLLSPPMPSAFVPLIEKILNLKSVVGFPLISKGDLKGVLIFLMKEKNYEELDDNRKQLLQTYTFQVGIALENATLFENLTKSNKEIQDARRKEKDMLDVMGHELRTPMSIIRTMLGMIKREQNRNNGQVKIDLLTKYLDSAMEATRREVALIETLLSATKIDAARIQVLLTRVSVNDMIRDGIEGQMEELKKRTNLKLDYKSTYQDSFMYADRTKVQEVMDNLVSNAIKYTPSGVITIEHWIKDGFNWVSISDNGIGIDEADLQNLGKKFFRAKYTKKDITNEVSLARPSGTGLGLYVTFELIRLMGGKLFINSKVGEGTTFTFGIPIYSDQPDKQIEQEFTPEDKSSPNRDHIVINGEIPR